MENFDRNTSQSQLPNGKVFPILLKNFATLGISPNLATQAYRLNGRIFMGFLVLGSLIYCTFVFVMYDANAFVEYVQAVYACSFGTLILLSLAIAILKVEKIFELINDFDSLINISKLAKSSTFTAIHSN